MCALCIARACVILSCLYVQYHQRSPSKASSTICESESSDECFPTLEGCPPSLFYEAERERRANRNQSLNPPGIIFQLNELKNPRISSPCIYGCTSALFPASSSQEFRLTIIFRRSPSPWPCCRMERICFDRKVASGISFGLPMNTPFDPLLTAHE